MKINFGRSLSLSLYLLFVALALTGCGRSAPPSGPAVQPPADQPCAEGVMVVEAQADAPARLSVKKATCGDHSSAVELVLENVSEKDISGYEISQTQDYEFRKNVQTAKSAWSDDKGIEIQPGQSTPVNFSGGFLTGYSYGKPVGLLQRNAFKISWIEFSDRTTWGQKTAPKG